MAFMRKILCVLGYSVATVLAGGLLARTAVAASAPGPDPSSMLAQQAQEVLQQRCYSCHGENGGAKKNVFVLDRARLVRSGVVVPGDTHSLLVKVVESGAMPMTGDKLSDAQVQALRNWVTAGAPDWGSPDNAKTNSFLSEKLILQLLTQDLEHASERDRPYLRYLSLAHLYNERVPANELEGYRQALSKLLNSLSWNPQILKLVPVDSQRTLFRIDLRKLRWLPETWNDVLAHYTYGVYTPQADRITQLSGVPVPYVRADWFVANASIPPLYHEILGLPQNLTALETMVGVNSALDVAQERDIVRAGVRNSGVALHNRVLERHVGVYGTYWRSYDFRSDQGEQNIFSDPVHLKPAGGEFIFNLPNGMQAYFIANAAGVRLDAAPEEIVTDRNHPDEPRVVNGGSCISCHFAGINTMRDEVRSVVTAQAVGNYDRDKALALYPEQQGVDDQITTDRERFRRAVEATGGKLGVDFRTEPITALNTKFKADLTVAQAAAETGLETHEFQARISQSSKLRALGFGQLLVADGGIKRNAWEAAYPDIVRELQLGEFVTSDRLALRPLPVVPDHAVPDHNEHGIPNPDLLRGSGTPNTSATPSHKGHYEIIDIGNVGPGAITALGLNITDQLVVTAQADNGHEHTFSLQVNQLAAGVRHDLVTLGGSSSNATAINDWGQIAGTARTAGDAAWHAFFSTGEKAKDLGTLGGHNSFATALNQSGQVVGYSDTVQNLEHAFRTTEKQPIHAATDDLGTLGGAESRALSINATGQVVGSSTTTDGHAHAFCTAPQKKINPATDDLGTLGGSTSVAWAINAKGSVVGTSSLAGNAASHAFLHMPEKALLDLGTLPGYNLSTARGINDFGQVVGYCENTGANGTEPAPPRAFIVFFFGSQMQDLNTLIAPDSGWVLQQAMSINNHGNIVGTGLFNGTPHAFLLLPH